jgi:hypothetical protein
MTEKRQRINIELGEKEAEGIYSNLAMISHTQSEVIIDFARVLPGVPKGKVYARIVMTPQHAKLLENALADNLGKFEGRYGKINVSPEEERNIGFQIPRESAP